MQPVYESLSEIDHVLRRPGMYLGGSADSREYVAWGIRDGVASKCAYTYSQLTAKCFQEILSNAVDNAIARESTFIDVEYTDPRVVTITNDGCAIPLENGVSGVPVPQMLFGELRTSSNYSDDATRVSAGLNGLGSKLTNIFSACFRVDIHQNGTRYTQVWRNNMKDVEDPVMGTTDYDGRISVSYECTAPTPVDDTYILQRLVHEAAATVPDVTVTRNGERVSNDYFALFGDGPTFTDKNVKWRLCVNEGEWCSMVNGVHTAEHGQHVDAVAKPIIAWLGTLDSNATAAKFLTVHTQLIVVATTTDAVFSSQDKAKLTRSAIRPLSLDATHKRELEPLYTAFKQYVEQRKANQSKRTDGKKTKTVSVPKLEDAELAGTKHSLKCTLILTEGDSAKTFAMSGTSVIGRDIYGIFPLRGKLLNTRDAEPSKILNNSEITSLKKIIGLRSDADYSTEVDRRTLRYGSVMILTDADSDGHHIKGLIINLFDSMWPTTFTIPGFLKFLRTPIVKTRNMEFFSVADFERYAAGHTVTKAKYFKGLGTSTREEACGYFRRIKELTVMFDCASSVDDLRRMFSKNTVPTRKKWIMDHIASPFAARYDSDLSFSDFVHSELLTFATDDVKRSIPHTMDGLKTSQRKVVHALLSLPETQRADIKVAQLAAITAQITNYHHGEQSLCECITGLAQDFVGSNNNPLLQAKGQFGSRLQGGADASSPRYIFTALTDFAKKLFRKEDEELLTNIVDDGQAVEPRFFLPIAPLILINGSKGIGTGFSTQIPPHDIRIIVPTLRSWLKAGKITRVDLRPYFSKFTGSVKCNASQYTTSAQIEQIGIAQYRISELPVGTWTDTFKDRLDKLVSEGSVESYNNGSSDVDVSFTIVSYDSDIVKKLRLSTSSATTNMHAFDENGLRKYACTMTMLSSWYTVRLSYYKRRLEISRRNAREAVTTCDNMVRYVNYIIENGVEFLKGDTNSTLSSLGFVTKNDSFNYLLDMRTRAFTTEHLAKLNRDLEERKKDFNYIMETNEYELWDRELGELMESI